ncbi:hypothetical protein F5B22DRAFT_651260 [Xylaria bambusicola]|uniref:uncharacterized protein n=1 Tax=Xylaria bambusicola TaxID=326684 RepID=UPI002008E8F1|nr:uncharacterized protein F5B22DRAFT_651260 [Xylaria bambusicola]KAI0505974.1 hypothetical protein F5B22DRAFT_651260 [Xylaria bambusicola]
MSSGNLNRRGLLLRMSRLPLAATYLTYASLVDVYVIFVTSLVATVPLIFWDVVMFAGVRTKLSIILIEINLLLELIFLGPFLYLDYYYYSYIAQIASNGAYYYHYNYFEVVGAVLCSFISSIGFACFYLNIRECRAHWVYKRDCRKIKPLLAFTETGSPVAVFPPAQDILLQRLSVDSLQEVHASQNEHEM